MADEGWEMWDKLHRPIKLDLIGKQFSPIRHPTSAILKFCGGGEMVDAGDLKSPPGNRVRVRVPPLALIPAGSNQRGARAPSPSTQHQPLQPAISNQPIIVRIVFTTPERHHR